MTLFPQNRFLALAITISVLAHGALLAVHFGAPSQAAQQMLDPGLEVILVNAKHDKKPLKADALAQANMDGGGNADQGRATSPLPDLQRIENGDGPKQTSKKVLELKQQQRRLLAQVNARSKITAVSADVVSKVQPELNADDDSDHQRMVARMEAEIAKEIQEYNKRPRKTQITASTREVGYAMYYKAMQERIERIGTLNFPQQDGRKLYGQLVLYIPIYQDGSLYRKDGGVRVERSSGNLALDQAAMRIVIRAAPFGRFPQNMRSPGEDDVWEIITRFNFTREDALHAELRSGEQ